jgi:Radical SAM superfamily
MDIYFGFHDWVKRTLPAGLRRAVRRWRARLMGVYGAWRVKRSVTRWLGPQFTRSRDRLELDITCACNLHCFNCNRSCEQARDQDHMSVGQVRRFLDESRERNTRWRLIKVIGGEPTIHPQFDEIIELLLQYRRDFSPRTRIVLNTNGYGDRVKKVLASLPPGIVVENTAKTSPVQPDFLTFNVAPRDAPGFTRVDYTNGCSIIKKCGFGLSPYGYYPCGPGGGIDRVFGFNIGRKDMPAADDDMKAELRKLCSVCGIFKRAPETGLLDGAVMSPTWSAAYARWKKQPPALGRYPEA